VNTKADIRFAVAKADFLPDWVKSNLVQQVRLGGWACQHYAAHASPLRSATA
jgi:hypothetical protein